MYKDKDKQREANRKAQAKFKAKGITIEGITDRVLPENVPPHGLDVAFEKTEMTKPYKMTVMERLFYRPAHLLKPGETNFVSLPGRACYGQA